MCFSYLSGKPVMIITEYMENGSLDTFLKVGVGKDQNSQKVGSRGIDDEYKKTSVKRADSDNNWSHKYLVICVTHSRTMCTQTSLFCVLRNLFLWPSDS